MYYNSTHETGPTLRAYTTQANRQEAAVLALFRQRRLPLSPSQVWRHLDPERTPLTSIRRAMTDLTDAGLLERLPVKVEGIYSRPEHLWRLSNGQ